MGKTRRFLYRSSISPFHETFQTCEAHSLIMLGDISACFFKDETKAKESDRSSKPQQVEGSRDIAKQEQMNKAKLFQAIKGSI